MMSCCRVILICVDELLMLKHWNALVPGMVFSTADIDNVLHDMCLTIGVSTVVFSLCF